MFLATLIVFLIILSILVLVHEYGHYIAARWAKVKVEEFALGLPFTRPLWSHKRKKDKMTLSVYPFLFGGFVKLLGEEDEGKLKDNPASFSHKKPPQRAVILVAGVAMNALLGIFLLYLMLSLSGFKTFIPDFAKYTFHFADQEKRVIVTEIKKGSPAEQAGIKEGDIIFAIGEEEIKGGKSMQELTKKYLGQKITISAYHKVPLNPKTVYAVPRSSPPQGEGPLGIAIADVVEISYPSLGQKTVSGLVLAYDMGVYTFKVLGTLIGKAVTSRTAEPVVSNLAGPVGIFNVTKTLLDQGGFEALFNLIQLTALMAINLAIFNILPFPALDGGRLLFVVIEGITGKKLKANWEKYIHQVGMAILLVLMVYVTFNDVVRIFTK